MTCILSRNKGLGFGELTFEFFGIELSLALISTFDDLIFVFLLLYCHHLAARTARISHLLLLELILKERLPFEVQVERTLRLN